MIPSLRQLRYFVRIVDFGSFSRAAEQLNVSQTALGAQIRQLEDELGVSLLERHSRGVSVTAGGAILHKRANEILRLLAETTREITAVAGATTDPLYLGISFSLVHLMASDILVRARSIMPQVSLGLTEEASLKLVDALVRGELDIVLAHDVPQDLGADREPWLREDLLFVTATDPQSPAPISSSRDIIDTISLAEALNSELALPLRTDGLRQIIETAAKSLGLRCRVAFEVQSLQALKILISDRCVSGIIPFGMAWPELRSGRFTAKRLVDPPVRRTLYLVRSGNRLSSSNEIALSNFLNDAKGRLLDLLGPLAVPVTTATSSKGNVGTAD